MSAERVSRVRVRRLRSLACPLDADPWGIGPISEAELRRRLERPPHVPATDLREQHLDRIARLIESDPRHWPPISIDVGVPGYGSPRWIIDDGNHRFAAAIIRGDQHIRACVSGSVRHAWELLRVRI